jgi:hypothetical protein
MASPYDILGLKANASVDEVQQAFRTLAQIYHPDRYTDAPQSVRDEATKRMKEITAAHQVLMDELKKDVVYRTKGWSNRRKADVTEKLLDAGAPLSWDGDYLTIPRAFKPASDKLVLRRQDQAPQADQRTWDVVFSVREPYFKQVRQELKRARIPHEWNGLEVKVARKYESAVDQIMARCVTTR